MPEIDALGRPMALSTDWEYLTVADLSLALADRLGADGWELVGWSQARAGFSEGAAWFKRPRRSKGEPMPLQVTRPKVETKGAPTDGTTYDGS